MILGGKIHKGRHLEKSDVSSFFKAGLGFRFVSKQSSNEPGLFVAVFDADLRGLAQVGVEIRSQFGCRWGGATSSAPSKVVCNISVHRDLVVVLEGSFSRLQKSSGG